MSLQSPGIELPFTNGFYQSGRSLQFSAQRCVNWYPNNAKLPALSRSNLYMTPGIRGIIDSTAGVNRGGAEFDGKPYFVNGDKLYRVDQTIAPDLTETYAAVEVGTIGGTGRVIMVPGQLDLVIVVPDQFSYSWNDGTSTFTALDGLPNFRTARDVVHINSLFVFLESDSNFIFHSTQNDPTTYLPLDFYQVIQISLGIGLLEYRNQLYVMGESLTIPFNDVGGVNFSFRPQPQAELPYGLRSVFAKTSIRGSAMFLGGGQNEEPGIFTFPNFDNISNEALDNKIQNLTDSDIDASFMIKHIQNDSETVAFSIGDECFVFDFTSGLWHERRSRYNEKLYRWRPNSIVRAYNRLLVGDYFTGSIGLIDDSVNTEYGERMFRTVVTQNFDNKGKAIKLKSLIVYMDYGFNGHIELDWSDDGGYSWSTPLRQSTGSVGDYGVRVQFDRLGAAANFRVLRLTTDTDKPCNINKIIAST